MKPLKRIDFAAPQPSLSKLPSVHESSYDPDGMADPDDVDDDDESLDSSSEDGQHSNGRRPRSSGGPHGEGNVPGSSIAGNMGNNGSISNVGVGGGSGGLGKLVAHASGGPVASSSTGAAFGRWL